MPDILTESVLSLTEATKVHPKLDGKRPATTTIWRWCRRGVRGVHLEYGRLGRRIVTSREAMGRFAARLAAMDGVPTPAPARPHDPTIPARTPTQREAAIALAERQLDAAGITT